MTYCEMKKANENKFNDFEGIFFAFSDKQFEEGMQKMGLNIKELDKVCSLGSGGYLLKTQKQAFKDTMNHFSDTMEKELKEETFLLEALTYELQNHEYCITGDISDTLETLGLTIKDITALPFGLKVLNEARIFASQDC